jgi:hypothetical protein
MGFRQPGFRGLWTVRAIHGKMLEIDLQVTPVAQTRPECLQRSINTGSRPGGGSEG